MRGRKSFSSMRFTSMNRAKPLSGDLGCVQNERIDNILERCLNAWFSCRQVALDAAPSLKIFERYWFLVPGHLHTTQILPKRTPLPTPTRLALTDVVLQRALTVVVFGLAILPPIFSHARPVSDQSLLSSVAKQEPFLVLPSFSCSLRLRWLLLLLSMPFLCPDPQSTLQTFLRAIATQIFTLWRSIPEH